MFEINYDDLQKLDISIGICLIVGAYLLFFTALLTIYNEGSALGEYAITAPCADFPPESINSCLEIIGQRGDFLRHAGDFVLILFLIMLSVGTVFFTKGYYSFRKSH